MFCKTKKEKFAIGIDSGGTKISGIVMSDQGKIVVDKVMLPIQSDNGDKQVLCNFVKIIDILINNCSQKITAIGVGAPTIDHSSGCFVNPPNLPFNKLNLKKYLEKKFKLPIIVDNDANVAAIGEAWLGGAKKYKSFVLITLGTGVGGAIFIDGQIYRGVHSLAGEIGHSKISTSLRKCACGKLGCLETICGGKSINKQYHQKFEDILKLNNGQSRKVIREYQEALTEAIQNLKMILDPEIIIFSGSITKSWNKLIKPVSFSLPVKKAILGDKAGVVGAAKLAFDNLK